MKSVSRRKFVKQSGWLAGGLVAAGPFLRVARANEPAPSEKLRIALIGSGAMGCGDLDCFLGFPEIECVAIADVDESCLAKGVEVCEKRERRRPETVKDFRRVLDRKDVDAVVIATPDHWHALPSVMACQAGKDVYVEKPLATTIDEGRAMLIAAQRHNRVAQMGSQWRSCRHMLEAAEFIKSGKLGKIRLARAWANLDWMPRCSAQPDGTPPAGVDYDFWLGPAPEQKFNPNRFHFNFRWYWDYAGGLMTDWGVHLLNMLFLALPTEQPKSVTSIGTPHLLDDAWETPGTQSVTYEFPSFNLIWEHMAGYATTINNHPWGVAWYGEHGIIMMNDAGWEILPERRNAVLDPEKHKGSGNPRPAHVRNFLDCIKTRQQPVLNLEIGHYLSTLAHLGNLAFRSGAKIQWNGEKERVIGNRTADEWVGRRYRKPWKLDYARRS